MQWYFYIACFIVISQLLILWVLWKNFRYALSNPWSEMPLTTPKTLLTVPCKGLDLAFETNIKSVLSQDYPDFIINFVVESVEDLAYESLCQLKEKFRSVTSAQEVNILVAGKTKGCSQKNHNLLFSYNSCPKDVKVLAFADSDVCMHKFWLRDMLQSLSQNKTGVTTGYRWFVPLKNSFATVMLSVSNSHIAQFLGKYEFNQVWGGSMAMLKDRFDSYGVADIWKNVISDDLALSYIVKKQHKKVVFVPSCLVASYVQLNIFEFLEFVRRQFTITRVYMPLTWFFGMVSSLYSVFGLAISIFMAIYAYNHQLLNHRNFYMLVPAVFLICHCIKAYFRANIVRHRLFQVAKKLRIGIIADFIAGMFGPAVILTGIILSCFGRIITWRGVKYKLISPEKTLIMRK